jgi:2-polyprenyl-6-methoxyphenol hydroxylase-like FAD-dependent oxidoreductase
MHDAIALANLIYTLPSNTSEEIEKIFKEYQTERIPPTIERYNGSQMMSKLISKSLVGVILGHLAKYIPQWFWRDYIKRGLLLRPWAGFLKAVENKGPLAAFPTPSTEKARELYNKRTGVQVV